MTLLRKEDQRVSRASSRSSITSFDELREGVVTPCTELGNNEGASGWGRGGDVMVIHTTRKIAPKEKKKSIVPR